MSDKPDWGALQKRVLNFLNAKYANMPQSQRMLPYYLFQDPDTLEEIPLSPNDAIREVTALTELGKKIITMQIRQINRVQSQ